MFSNTIDGWELLTLANREISRVMEPNLFYYNSFSCEHNTKNYYEYLEDRNDFVEQQTYENEYEDTFSDYSDNESDNGYSDDENEDYEVNSDNEWVSVK